MIRCKSYAKINLYLDILPKRPDGYHDIETIFQTVDLCDTLELSAADGISLHCDHPDLANDLDDNLVTRAARLLQKHAGCVMGAEMTLTKRIPVAAGLAGGSGNAAAALRGLNELWDVGCTDTDLAALAIQLGSDVPYCLRGGSVAATGRGEAIEPLTPARDTWCCLVHPPIAVSTAAMYSHPLLQKNTSGKSRGRTADFEAAIRRFEAGDIAGVLFNRMQPPAIADHPELQTYIDRLEANGCDRAIMSGSGPTVFGITKTKEDADRVAAVFDDVPATVARFADQGVVIERSAAAT